MVSLFFCFSDFLSYLFLMYVRKGVLLLKGTLQIKKDSAVTPFDPFPQPCCSKTWKNCFHPRRKSRSPSPRRRSSPVRRERKRSHSRSPRHRTKSRSPSPAPEKKEKTPELPEPSMKVKEPSVQEATSTRQVHKTQLWASANVLALDFKF